MQLEHDNILKFYGIVEGFGLLPALVSPWMENGSLDNYLTKQSTSLSMEEVSSMVRNVPKKTSRSDKSSVNADSRWPPLLCINNLILP